MNANYCLAGLTEAQAALALEQITFIKSLGVAIPYGLIRTEALNLKEEPMNDKKPPLPPWVTIDQKGIHHFDIPLLMRISGIPDNPHNREMTTKVAAEILQDMYPGVPLHIVEKE